VVAALGLLAALVGLATRHARDGALLMLDLWTAAGLLNLAASPSWQATGSAAAIVLVRRLLLVSLRHTRLP
jgi:hypothetical protein